MAQGNDPSMEDILASIRRILNEEPAPVAEDSGWTSQADAPDDDGELLLDETMLSPPPLAPVIEPEEAAMPPEVPMPEPVSAFAPAPAPAELPASDELLSAAASAFASGSMMSLVRAVSTERHVAVHRAGPTLEDMVREALKPLLKTWLDTNLPPLVERLVRAEIDRVVSRAMP